MRRLLFAGALFSMGAVLPGCPVYASQECFDSSDCPRSYVCDSHRGQCVTSASSVPTGSSSRSCVSSAQCRTDETCGLQGVCSVGDCSTWGCVRGSTCQTLGGLSVCVSDSLAAGGGAAASGGAGGASFGGQGGAGGDVGGRAGAAGGAQETRYETNGLPPASGTLLTNNGEWQLPLGGMASRPASSPATLSLAGGDPTKGELWTFTVSGQPDAVNNTLVCNATTDPHALCRFFFRRTEGGTIATYVDSGAPFSIVWSSWGDGNFRGVASNVGAIRTAGGVQTTYSFDRLTFDVVAQTAP